VNEAVEVPESRLLHGGDELSGAGKVAIQLLWMMRKEWRYEQVTKFGSHAGQPGTGDGVK